MTIRLAQEALTTLLKTLYEEREARAIADWVMEHLTGLKKIDRLLNKQQTLTPGQISLLHTYTEQLASYKPVQYVLGEAWFASMKFYVNEQVLIPRPETEELVEWILHTVGSRPAGSILDIGTGSGCIPISLKKKLPGFELTSMDISHHALEVARQNAVTLETEVRFLQADFLDETTWTGLPVYDIIVSNPPYIKQMERNAMAKHVVDHEPGIALFVPDDDALLFYRKIALFGKTHLSEMIFLEINETMGREVTDLFNTHHYNTILRKDLQGRDRMLKAWKG